MTANIEQLETAGLEAAFWARNGTDGYPKGQTGTLANGSDSGLARMTGIKSLSLTQQPPREVVVSGDDGPLATFFFKPETLPNGDLQLGLFDVNMFAQAQNINVYADGDWDTVVLQANDIVFNDLTLMTYSQAESAMSGSVGQKQWYCKFYPKVQIVPLGDGGLTEADATSFNHRVIAKKTDKLPWGISMSVANQGTLSGVGIAFASEYRPMLHTFIGNASATTITLIYTPAAATANKIKVYKNGVLLTITTDWTVSGKVITMASAPAAGDVVIIRYEWSS